MESKVAHITTIALSLRYLLLNQLRSLHQAGHDIYGISSPGPEVPNLEAAGIHHIAVPMTRTLSPFADLRSLWRLYQVIRREQFTIVHTHNPKPGLLGQVAARLAGVPIVVNTLHGFYFHEYMPPIWRWFYILIEKIAARCSDVIFSQNREDIQTAIRENICEPERIKYLGNGIDLKRFDPAQFDTSFRARKRAELGLPPGVPVVGFVGRLVREKGLPELLSAMKIVWQQLPTARLLVIGPIDSDKPDAIRQSLAQKPDLHERCIFLGLRQDMPELYATMDIFVLPSHREGFPRAPMEASAMKVPTIVTNIRGCREVVEHGRNGLLVPVQNVEALAQAIVELLSDTQKAEGMRDECRRIALERFDERRVFEVVRAEYRRLLQAKNLYRSEPASTSNETS